MGAVNPEPGDWAVGPIGGPGGLAIGLAESIAERSVFRKWEHALVYIGHGQVLQAEPRGAEIVPLEDVPDGFTWSTGLLHNPNTDLDSAIELGLTMAGKLRDTKPVPYSALDYVSIGLHRLHIPAPHLRKYIAASGHQICSQLVDYFELQRGWHLFADDRWPGDVMPYDLGKLLLGKAAPWIPAH